MENRICSKCGYLSYSKTKERRVMCKCLWDRWEAKEKKEARETLSFKECSKIVLEMIDANIIPNLDDLEKMTLEESISLLYTWKHGL